MIPRNTLYDIVSLALLILGGFGLLVALYFALSEMWMKSVLFAVACLALWYMSTNFARLAIAASGRQ